MRRFILLAPLLLAACGTTNAQLAQNSFTHDGAVCEARGYDVDSDAYVTCMRKLGGRVGYQLAKLDDGSLVFHIPESGPGWDNHTWQPAPYIPPVNAYR